MDPKRTTETDSAAVEDDLIDGAEHDLTGDAGDDAPPDGGETQADDGAAVQGDGEGGEPEDGGADGGGAEADEVVVTIGDEPPPADDAETQGKAPEWVRELRKSNREKDRRIRELESRLNSGAQEKPAQIVVGEKPTLEGCGFDADKFEAEFAAWSERKRQSEAEAERQRQAEEAVKRAWQSTMESFQKQKAALKVSDFDDAEEVVREAFSVTQQALLVKSARPAELVYALGKNPKKAKELAAISDPVDFVYAAARLEAQLKVQPKKPAPPAPDRVVRSSVSGAAAVDNELDRLRKEAERTGNYSKVHAYKAKQRERAAA